MPVKNYRTGIVVTGDAEGGVRATKLTEKQLKNLNQTAKRSGDQARKTSKDFDMMGASLGKLKTVAGAALAAVAGGGIGAVGVQALRAVKEVDTLSSAIGVQTNTLLEWQAAAETVGVNADKMGDILKDTADKIGDFLATGGGEAADIFERLNLNVNELRGLSADQQLLKIAEGLDQVGTQAEKVFLLEALADDASRLLPLLEGNAAGLREVVAELDAMGVTLDAVELQVIRDANKELDMLAQAGQGVANELGQAIAPLLTEFGPTLRDWAVDLVGWIGEIGDSIRTGFAFDSLAAQFSIYTDTFSGELSTLWGWVKDGFSALWELLDADLLELFQTWPAYARAGFAEMIGFADRFALDIAETWDLLGVGASQAWAVFTNTAGQAWGSIRVMASEAVDYILERLAALVGQVRPLGDVLGSVPGLEGVSESIDQAAASLRNLSDGGESARAEMLANAAAHQVHMQALEQAKAGIRAAYDSQREASLAAVDAAGLELSATLEQRAAAIEAAEAKHEAALAAEALAAADADAAKAGGVLSASLENQAGAADDFAKSLNSLIDRLDPAASKTRVFLEEIALLDQAWLDGVISGEYHEQLISRLTGTTETQTETIKKQAETADPWAEAWIGALERVDKAFAGMWSGTLDGFDSFADQMIASAKQLFGEIAHALTTRPILVSLGLGGLGASGAASAGGIGGGLGIDSVFSLLSSPFVGIGEALVGAGATSFGAGMISGAGALSQGPLSFLSSIPSLFSQGGFAAGIGGLLPAALPILGMALPLLGGLFEDTDETAWSAGESTLGRRVPRFGSRRPDFRTNYYQTHRDEETGGFGLEYFAYETQAGQFGGNVINGPFGSESDARAFGESILAAGRIEQAIIDGLVTDLEGFRDALGDAVTDWKVRDDVGWKQAIDEALEGRFSTIFGVINEDLQSAFDSLDVAAENIAQQVTELFQKWQLVQSLSEEFSAVDLQGVEQIVEAGGGLGAYTAGLAVYFDAFYTAEEKLERHTESLTETLNELGLDAIPASRAALRELVDGLDLSTDSGRALHGALIALIPELDQWYKSAEALGVAAGDAAESTEALAKQAEALADFRLGLEDQLAELTLNDFQLELRSISQWMEKATAEANELGASTEDLALIQQIAALRTREAIAGLQTEIDGLISQLYGGAGDSGLSAINTRIRLEQQRIGELQRAANDLYRTELQRFEDSRRMIDSIGDHLASIAQGSLSPLTPLQRYQAAQSDYSSTLAAARGGDAGALSDLLGRRSALLEASQYYNASSAPYLQDYGRTEADLIALANQLGLITEPGAPGESGSSAALRALEAERERLQQRKAQAERAALAGELALKIGDLGLALDSSVFELLEANGVSIEQLASDFGLDIQKLDDSLVRGLLALSRSLRVDFIELSDELGIDLVALATQYGFDIERLGRNLDNWLASAAKNIGSDIFDLAEALGVDLAYLGNLIADELGIHIDPLGKDIRDQLRPHLDAIAGAAGGDQLQTALANLQAAVSKLPAEERRQLQPYLTSIIQTTGGTKSEISKTLDPLFNVYAMLRNTNAALSSIGNWQRLIRANMQDIDRRMGGPGYRDGGIAYGPQSGHLEMLHGPEAVVPLPDGRAIPVSLYGPGDGMGGELAAIRRQLEQNRRALLSLMEQQHNETLKQRGAVASAQVQAIDDLAAQQVVRAKAERIA